MANKPGWGEGRDGIDQKTGKPWFLFDHTPWIAAAMRTSMRKLGEKHAREHEQKILEIVAGHALRSEAAPDG